jgi:hypothetical protein
VQRPVIHPTHRPSERDGNMFHYRAGLDKIKRGLSSSEVWFVLISFLAFETAPVNTQRIQAVKTAPASTQSRPSPVQV